MLEPPTEDRLDSWKEIAAYLKRDVTTVQRWERREEMPVHRHLHDKGGSVHAFRTELDAWAKGRTAGGAVVADEVGQRSEETPILPRTGTRHLSNSTEVVEVEMGFDGSERPAVVAPPDGLGPTAGHTSVTGYQRTAVPIAAALGLMLATAAIWWYAVRGPSTWRDPLTGARFESLTDFGGIEQAAAVSHDGRFVAFLSDRDGPMDVWVTQVGTGQFYNLTRGRAPQLVNPEIRTLDFSPDGTLVTFWARGGMGAKPSDINVWAVPTLGGQPRPYLQGAAEFAWSQDGTRVAYHTPEPGDPMFVASSIQPRARSPIFSTAPGLHAHFPMWSAQGEFIYFVQGTVPDAMDLWRVAPTGGDAERITTHNARVSHPVLLNDRTLLYLATDSNGAGPWLHSLDVGERIPRRVGAGIDRYTSLAATSDGRRLVATLSNPKGTFWRLRVGDTADAPSMTPISLTTGRGSSPRLGPGYLLYVASAGAGEGIWKLADGAATQLWSAPGARIVGGPDITRDGHRVAFTVEQSGQKQLYTMDADGTNQRLLTDALDLRGAPSWTPDGEAIASAVNVGGTPQLFRISLDGTPRPLVREYSMDPEWSPSGDFVVYSGADVGTVFPLKAVTATARPYGIPTLNLTRGVRSVRVLEDGRTLMAMLGSMEHKDVWLIDLKSGARRQVTTLPDDFEVRDFDVSADGRDIVLERVQEHADIVLIDLAP